MTQTTAAQLPDCDLTGSQSQPFSRASAQCVAHLASGHARSTDYSLHTRRREPSRPTQSTPRAGRSLTPGGHDASSTVGPTHRRACGFTQACFRHFRNGRGLRYRSPCGPDGDGLALLLKIRVITTRHDTPRADPPRHPRGCAPNFYDCPSMAGLVLCRCQFGRGTRRLGARRASLAAAGVLGVDVCKFWQGALIIFR